MYCGGRKTGWPLSSPDVFIEIDHSDQCWSDVPSPTKDSLYQNFLKTPDYRDETSAGLLYHFFLRSLVTKMYKKFGKWNIEKYNNPASHMYISMYKIDIYVFSFPEPPPLYSRTWGTNSKDLGGIRVSSGVINSTVGRSCSGELTRQPPATLAAYYTPDAALNVQAFKEKILDTRLPESCV